jgi:hypothetical protein
MSDGTVGPGVAVAVSWCSPFAKPACENRATLYAMSLVASGAWKNVPAGLPSRVNVRLTVVSAPATVFGTMP